MDPEVLELLSRLMQGDDSVKARLIELMWEGNEDARQALIWSTSPESRASMDAMQTPYGATQTPLPPQGLSADIMDLILESVGPLGAAAQQAAGPATRLLQTIMGGPRGAQATAPDPRAAADIMSVAGQRAMPQDVSAVPMGAEPELRDLLMEIMLMEDEIVNTRARGDTAGILPQLMEAMGGLLGQQRDIGSIMRPR